jgi:hypothetical protein
MVALEFCSERHRDGVQFVDAIRLGVPDSAIASTISLLSRPPGRKPDENLVALSAWFNGLGLRIGGTLSKSFSFRHLLRWLGCCVCSIVLGL